MIADSVNVLERMPVLEFVTTANAESHWWNQLVMHSEKVVVDWSVWTSDGTEITSEYRPLEDFMSIFLRDLIDMHDACLAT